MNNSSNLIADFIAGRAMPEQWLGLAFLVAVLIAGIAGLIRQHVRDERDDARGRR